MWSINKPFVLACAALVLSGEWGLVWAGCGGPRWVRQLWGLGYAQACPAPPQEEACAALFPWVCRVARG